MAREPGGLAVVVDGLGKLGLLSRHPGECALISERPAEAGVIGAVERRLILCELLDCAIL
ncbi:hypothetical protein [Methylosinus sporium]|uniref:hypothetical protein n=1 Tax=Methylosinus sporium TaxID=428 RepID=UPI003DA73AA6